MVAFPSIRTPPKLRTPTKLSISFTRRSTPRPTPRSSRGGRVKALIDKFNGLNQTADISIDRAVCNDDEMGVDSGAETPRPAKNKSFRSFNRMKSISRSDAHLSMDVDKKSAASDDSHGMKHATSDGPFSVHKLSPETATDKVEKVMGPSQTDASADNSSVQSFSPLALTTSSVEPIHVKTLPYDCDDEDKENVFSLSVTRDRVQTSQIDESWLSVVKNFSPRTSSASSGEIESTATINDTAQKLQERHLEQQASTEKLLTASARNRKSRPFSTENPKGKLKEKDLIEALSVANNVKISDKCEKIEMVNDTKENMSKSSVNGKYAKFGNSRINSIKMRSKKHSPNRSKPPLYQCNEVHGELEAPIGYSSQILSDGVHDSCSLGDNEDLRTTRLAANEHDTIVKRTNHRVVNNSQVIANDVGTNALASTKMSVIVQLLAPNRSESPLFHQQARSAAIAAGIESTDADHLQLNTKNVIVGMDKKPLRESNSKKQNGIDDDVIVMMTKGSECETIEITKTRSSIQQPRQHKGRKVRKSAFHTVALNAMNAAEVAEQKNQNQQNAKRIDDMPIVDGIVEVTTVTSNDETDIKLENRHDDDVEEEIFLDEIGTNDHHLPPPATTTTAEECTMIVSASSSASSRNEYPLPTLAPAPAALPSQSPKVDNVQLLMPYLVSYGNPTTQSSIPCYQYGQQWCHHMNPPAQLVQYFYYPPPPPPPTSGAGTIYIHI